MLLSLDAATASHARAPFCRRERGKEREEPCQVKAEEDANQTDQNEARKCPSGLIPFLEKSNENEASAPKKYKLLKATDLTSLPCLAIGRSPLLVRAKARFGIGRMQRERLSLGQARDPAAPDTRPLLRPARTLVR